MNPPPDPDDGETPTADWIGFALNVGLKLAETFGLGLTLFNAMRARFPDVAGAIIGDIVSTIGQAVRTATGLTTDQLNQALPLGDLPIVPASWHQGEPSDRVLAGVNVTGVGPDIIAGEERRVWVNGTEYNSVQELLDAASDIYARIMGTQTVGLESDSIEAMTQLIFAAKRF